MTRCLLFAFALLCALGPPSEASSQEPEVELEVGRVEILGSLPRSEVQGMLSAHLDEMKACYAGALESNPEQEGRVVMRLVVVRDGSVLRASVRSSELSEEVGACLSEAMVTWSVPAGRCGAMVMVSAPLDFALRRP